ncbi:MAG: glycosyltransferase family 61 protein [Paracoccus sp. (in: a-proteobacteria)]|uniref:glycosyltransferase 61 family protein n=1 Tax=Paracoccus sp. TaxID=267 RepID=UPI0026E084BC|nr:glycosyltransferase family 61 protein [Paracoccus sp. (in: a-proteobacteria)]MDO5613177.1 glycosyltransferase family 61 protein [Paracoccus sp. (in: a-proteobacteria)]
MASSALSASALFLKQHAERIGNSLAYRLNFPRGQYHGLPAPQPKPNGQMVPCRTAVFDPDQLSRVTACGFGRELHSEVMKLTATAFLEVPADVFELGPATVAGGMVFSQHGHYAISPQRPGFSQIRNAEPIDSPVVLANSAQGLKFFGHWVADDTTVFEHYRDHPGLLSLPRPVWKDAAAYEQLFDHDWHEVAAFSTPSLTLVRELGFNLSKAERFTRLRDRMRGKIAPVQPGRIVFIRRGGSGANRDIVNWPELEPVLEQAGITILTPEDDTGEFIRQLLDASLIISVEGSQMCHAQYGIRPGGAVLVLQPPDRFYNPHHEWTRLMDIAYGFVVGRTAEGGFTIDADELLSMADRLLTMTGNLPEV